jgi:O-antigen ligase
MASVSMLFAPREGVYASTIAAVLVMVGVMAAFALGGLDGRSGALGLAFAVIVLFCVVVSNPVSRDVFFDGQMPVAAGALFCVALAMGLFQLLPLKDFAVPAWAQYGLGGPAFPTLDRGATQAEIGKLFALGCAFLIGVSAGRERATARFTLQAGLLIGTAFIVYACLLGVWRSFATADEWRFDGGLVGRQNVAAAVYLWVALSGFALIWRAVQNEPLAGLNRPQQAIALIRAAGLPAWFAFGLGLVAIMLVGSRGGLLAWGVGMATFFAFDWVSKRKSTSKRADAQRTFLAIAGLVAAFVLALALFGEFMVHRLGADGMDGRGRGDLVALYWPLFEARPWLGYGLGGFEVLHDTVTPAARMDLAGAGALHNVYLQWLIEAGLIGALAIIGAAALLIGGIAKGALTRRRDRQRLCLGLAVSVAIAFHAAFDVTLNVYPAAILAALMLGLNWAIAHQRS